MKLVNIKKITILAFTSLLLIIPLHNPEIKADSGITINKLLSEDLADWFNTNAGVPLTADAGGVYVMKAVGDQLFLGLNEDYPGEDHYDSLLASHDGSELTFISEITEDALFRMKVQGNKLYIPGYDPDAYDGYGWDAGNMYVYDTSTDELVLKRYRYDDWHFIDSRTSDVNGEYSFENLKATSYLVRIINPEDYKFSPYQAEGGPGFTTNDYDSSFEDTFGGTVICNNTVDTGINFMNPQMDETVDGGLYFEEGFETIMPPNISAPVDNSFYSGTYGVGGRIWNDTNENGIQDAGENGMNGIRVELYTKDPYFPCAIHMPAMYADENELIVNYGHYYPSTFAGDISSVLGNATWRSTDGGETWEIMSDQTNNYYAYDIEKLNGWYYKTNWNRNQRNIAPRHFKMFTNLEYSSNGTTWGSFQGTTATPTATGIIIQGGNPYDIYGHLIPFTSELIAFKDKFIFMDNTGQNLYRFYGAGINDVINVDGADFSGILPGFDDVDQYQNDKVSDTQAGMMHSWQTFANVNDEYFYGIGKDNKIYVSTDVKNWTTVADFSDVDEGAPLTTLAYWPNKNWLVAATVGENGSVYYIDLDEIESEVITKIANNQGLDFFNDLENVDLKNVGGTGEINITTKKDSFILSKSSVDLGNDGGTYNWNAVKGNIDTDKGRSFIYGLTSATGSSTTHNLYIPIADGETSETLIICPDADTLAEVRTDCEGKVEFEENETKQVNGVNVTATKTTIDGINYWVASGVNGTGGIAYYDGYTDPVIPVEEPDNEEESPAPNNSTSNGNAGISFLTNNAGVSSTIKPVIVSEIVSYPVSYLSPKPTTNNGSNNDQPLIQAEIPTTYNSLPLVLICIGLILTGGVIILFVTRRKDSNNSY